jgi:hypothetical protein
MIKMEHPRLPVSEQGPPVQLWRKKLDAKVKKHRAATSPASF